MLVPLGLTRSNEAATRETCRGHNEPRRRAKALHTPTYSSCLETQALSDENNFAERDGPCRRWYLQADAGASSTLCASQLQREPHQARLPLTPRRPDPESSDRPRARSCSRSSRRAAAPAISRERDDSHATGQAVARRRSAPWLSLRVGRHHQRLRSGRPPEPTPARIGGSARAIRMPKRSREPIARPGGEHWLSRHAKPHRCTSDTPELRGKRDSAVLWDVAARAEPTTVSESAQCETRRRASRSCVARGKEV
jgi:hypothetical protein